MKHLGDITKLSGYVVPAVDVVIGGSPCQGLSVAGKQAGLKDERSGLFIEQIRLVKEMRKADAARGKTNDAIDHIRDAPAVSQQELRSCMLPWFSPFAAPWCGKIQRAFPKAYVTMNFELILVPRTNTYINLNHCSTPDEFKAEVIEGVSRFAFKAFTKPLRKEHLDGINKLLDTKFTPEDMEYIYTNLGNGINHELCMKFVKSGYDLKVIEESV